MSDLLCPLDCGQPLHLMWALTQSVNVYDDGGVEPMLAPEPNVQTWQVECEAGHVLLLPGDAGCPDEYDPSEACPHADMHDWSDDYRSFRTDDADRLAALCRRLGGAS